MLKESGEERFSLRLLPESAEEERILIMILETDKGSIDVMESNGTAMIHIVSGG